MPRYIECDLWANARPVPPQVEAVDENHALAPSGWIQVRIQYVYPCDIECTVECHGTMPKGRSLVDSGPFQWLCFVKLTFKDDILAYCCYVVQRNSCHSPIKNLLSIDEHISNESFEIIGSSEVEAPLVFHNDLQLFPYTLSDRKTADRILSGECADEVLKMIGVLPPLFFGIRWSKVILTWRKSASSNNNLASHLTVSTNT